MKRSQLFLLCSVITILAAPRPVTASNDMHEQKKACSADQTKAAGTALSSARTALDKAIVSFRLPTKDDTTRQTRWFGTLSADQLKRVQQNFERSVVLAVFAQFWCPLNSNLSFKWFTGDMAAVHKDAAGQVFLTPDFFKLAISGVDSQMGTFVHELTHQVGIGLRPEVYGKKGALDLASTNPQKAMNNSDNYQYYVEDLMFKIP